MSLDDAIGRLRKPVEQALDGCLASEAGDADRVREAARYSLLGGGKRIRPVMMLAVADMVGVSRAAAMPLAAAIELIHTYSLIHDDLPCMDDDDLRRGRPTCHVRYDEATAVLAGDLLLNSAFELLWDTAADLDAPDRMPFIRAARRLAKAAGLSGMIGGQAADLRYENRPPDPEALTRMHRMKTGALFTAALLAPMDLAGAPEHWLDAMHDYAEDIGLAFQIKDDLLDVTASARELGKTPGKDAASGKMTFVRLYGQDEAARLLEQCIQRARTALLPLQQDGLDTEFLSDLAGHLGERTS